MSYCEVCGYYFEGNRKCPMSNKAHKKIEKLIKLYGDVVHEALMNNDRLKDSMHVLLESATDEVEIDKAYTGLVMAYYIRLSVLAINKEFSKILTGLSSEMLSNT